VEKILKGFKGSKIGKYDVIIRPYASTNSKDNISAFLGNISANIDEADLQKYLHEYEPIISCKIMTNNPRSINASVTFANEYFYNY
jgi:RNA recognition motif-containing protein